jgi:hypothetical protein
VLDAADLRDALVDGCNLRGASLESVQASGSSFTRADLTLAQLRGSDFRSANLSEALLTDANLCGANFERAALDDADLIGAELAGASFRSAGLRGANLRDAHLDGADFSDARFAFTVLAASDLSRARGLESVIHEGPSTVGIDAFLLSRGEIADAFLSGIGLSPLTIEYLKAVAAAEEGMLVGDALFLLFSDADRARARRIRAYLRMHRHQAWYWQQLGELTGQHNPGLKHRVRFHDRLIVLCSAACANDRGIDEPLARALDLEKVERRRIVFAVRLEDSPASTSTLDLELADRFVADFRGADWDDPADGIFRRELERLLSRLEPR